MKRKYYVVWQGLSPGIYDSWEECQAQVEGFAGARYKSFPDIESATAAFRGSYEDQASLLIALAARTPQSTNIAEFPEIRTEAWAVDGACSGAAGPMEYQCVDVGTGQRIFHVGPLEGGTNNIAEYLALIHALALLDQRGDYTRPIYSDSRTALAWLRNRHSKTTLSPAPDNAKVFELLARADRWIATHRILNPVLKWKTDEWGEIPADFHRK